MEWGKADMRTNRRHAGSFSWYIYCNGYPGGSSANEVRRFCYLGHTITVSWRAWYYTVQIKSAIGTRQQLPNFQGILFVAASLLLPLSPSLSLTLPQHTMTTILNQIDRYKKESMFWSRLAISVQFWTKT